MKRLLFLVAVVTLLAPAAARAADPCDTDLDCWEGEACIDGYCHELCVLPTDCGFDELCLYLQGEDFGICVVPCVDDMDCDNWALTEMGQQVSAGQYLAAVQAHQDYRRSVTAWWADGFDLLVTPTISAPPPRIGEMVPDPAKPLDAFLRSGALLPFTLPFNVTGQPAVSLPLHWNDAGLPIGVQFIAAMGREDLLLRIASQL